MHRIPVIYVGNEGSDQPAHNYVDINQGFYCPFSFYCLQNRALFLQPCIFSAREGTNYPPDATIDAKEFVIRDFVVSSSIAVFGNVTADGTKVEVSR